mmetsp:Transcript_27414/g.49441  ORF Transcript_27414/g.49441 Transcript_27414/m.49441 type:complete len:201 (-) Transcript_27414:12-614(-)
MYLFPIFFPFTSSLNASVRVSWDANTTWPNPRSLPESCQVGRRSCKMSLQPCVTKKERTCCSVDVKGSPSMKTVCSTSWILAASASVGGASSASSAAFFFRLRFLLRFLPSSAASSSPSSSFFSSFSTFSTFSFSSSSVGFATSTPPPSSSFCGVVSSLSLAAVMALSSSATALFLLLRLRRRFLLDSPVGSPIIVLFVV